MKIASQLLSTTPNTVTKTGASFDNGAEFQGLLTAAAAKGSSSNDAPQIKGKLQTLDAKSQTPEIKKKSVASDSTVAAVPVPIVPAPKQLLADAVTQIASSLPPAQEASTQSSDQILNNPHAGEEVTGGKGSLPSSTASISPVVQLSTNVSTIRWADQQAANGYPKATDSSEKAAELPVTDGTERLVSNATSSHPELETARIAAAQSLQPQGDIASTTAIAAPATAVLPSATAAVVPPASVGVAKTVSAAPVTTLPVVLPAPVAATNAASSLPVTVSPVVPPAPVAATKIAVATPVAATKTASSLPATVSPVVPPARVAAASIVPAAPVAPPAVGLTAPVVAAPVIAAVPVSPSVTPKAAATDQAASAWKPTDISDSNPAVTVVDTTPLAAQQAAAAVVQSVATPASFPSLNFGGEAQASLGTVASQTSIAGSVADTAKEASSRQTSSAVKSKPAPGTSAPGNRYSDSSSSANTQTDSTSTAATSPAPKVSEAPGTGNQGAGDSKSFDIANLQQTPPAGPADGANHISQPSQSVNASAETAVQPLPAQAVPDSQPMQGVSSAQLIQSMHSSEMKLGMQSAEFGNISISTSLNHQALSAQISIDHSELGRALAVHLPAIEEKLGSAYGVQAKVELRDSNNPSSSNDSGYSNSGQQSREQRQSQGGGSSASQGPMFERIAARASFTPASTTVTASRLDIRI